MKKRLVFAYYSDKESDMKIVDKIHFALIDKYKWMFDERIICILTNYPEDTEYIESLKENIYKNAFNNTKVDFIVMRNEPDKREGKAFKEIIYDHLDELDGLTMFAHTKAKTSYKVMANQTDLNMYKWIVYSYIGCLKWFLDDEYMIDDFGDYLSYGSLYMYDRRLHDLNNMKHNWCYSGSFQWLNCKKIARYIKENSIDMSMYDENFGATHYIRRIAENFIGDVIPPSLAGFHLCQRMNVTYPAISDQPMGICYSDVDTVLARTIPVHPFLEYVNGFNDFKNNVIDKLND